ncbi:GH92 family glycosyl hydrolase [Paraburkholderia acidicola]|uniref:GH92 family glycosyl hydrolase n=1 Tax=Paraburkholderia acidicola TaxID=1912599 RepID=A0ABV1LGV3_9BURK
MSKIREIFCVLSAVSVLAGCGGDVHSVNSLAKTSVPAGSGAGAATPATGGTTTPTTAAAQTPVVMQLTQYVNERIGTNNGGGTSLLAGLPAGMVQWGPDTPNPGGINQWTTTGYFDGATTISDFSLTHLSGTGCHDGGGGLPVMPGTASGSSGAFSSANETTKPGYYGVTLSNGIHTELTATLRSGLGRFTWPAGKSAQLTLTAKSEDYSSGGNIAWGGKSAPTTVSGSFKGGNFCNDSQSYTVYFYATFDQSFTAKTQGSKATLTFTPVANTPLVVNMRVGLSYVSVANAQANLQQEQAGANGALVTFDTAAANADAAWNTRLNTIQVSGGSTGNTTKFYTALYHASLAPSVISDVNGNYPVFGSSSGLDANGKPGQTGKNSAGQTRVQYTTFSSWDTYRSLMPLLAVIAPHDVSDMMQSLVNDGLACGNAFPQWIEGTNNSNVMPADTVSTIISQSYLYGATDFDTASALKIMLNDETNPSAECTNIAVLPGLSDYTKLGYLPDDDNIVVDSSHSNGTSSTTLEYATTDFAVSRFAQAMGDSTNAAMLLTRSHNWVNLMKPNATQVNNVSVTQLQPRNQDGSWPGYTSSDPVEGTAEEYTWMVPFNIGGLFNMLGGDQAVISRLTAFEPQLVMTNEPMFATPWLYNWTSRPDKTQAVVANIAATQYLATPSGLPGNDDEGATSGWFIWAALGLYPMVPAEPGFTVASPLFTNETIYFGNGKTLTITANTPQTYIQSMTVNGAAYNSTWLPFDTVKNGATIVFNLGASAPVPAWGAYQSAQPVPPSPGGA